ncbi:phosphatidylserine decarboxylase proenzyme [Spirochaetia bacterium]|nr:phosphatidylserine decarboxylase proenzyme [Spirochaetia bacterium]
MRIPLTKYGLPQLILFPAAVFVLMLLLLLCPGGQAPQSIPPALLFGEIPLLLVFIWTLSFFRDPERKIVMDEGVLYSPADGTITDITEVDGDDQGNGGGIGERALRIGMFLSLFSVHINRAPCAVRIEGLSYKKGAFRNAMSAESGKINESNDVLMKRLSPPFDTLLVRQISGAVARHIVCAAKPGDTFKQGDRFGMIKFGSRTELYLPVNAGGARYEVAVKIGDKVHAGISPLVRYKA